jgi:hypothetical protein
MHEGIVCQGCSIGAAELGWLRDWIDDRRQWSRHQLAVGLCRPKAPLLGWGSKTCSQEPEDTFREKIGGTTGSRKKYPCPCGKSRPGDRSSPRVLSLRRRFNTVSVFKVSWSVSRMARFSPWIGSANPGRGQDVRPHPKLHLHRAQTPSQCLSDDRPRPGRSALHANTRVGT